MVERELPKLIMRVRFPLPAPFFFVSVQVADFFVSFIFFRKIGILCLVLSLNVSDFNPSTLTNLFVNIS